MPGTGTSAYTRHSRRGQLAIGAALVWLLAAGWASGWLAIVAIVVGGYGVVEFLRAFGARRAATSPAAQGADPVLLALCLVIVVGVTLLVVGVAT